MWLFLSPFSILSPYLHTNTNTQTSCIYLFPSFSPTCKQRTTSPFLFLPSLLSSACHSAIFFSLSCFL